MAGSTVVEQPREVSLELEPADCPGSGVVVLAQVTRTGLSVQVQLGGAGLGEYTRFVWSGGAQR